VQVESLHDEGLERVLDNPQGVKERGIDPGRRAALNDPPDRFPYPTPSGFGTDQRILSTAQNLKLVQSACGGADRCPNVRSACSKDVSSGASPAGQRGASLRRAWRLLAVSPSFTLAGGIALGPFVAYPRGYEGDRMIKRTQRTDLQAFIEDAVKSGGIPTEDLGGPLQFFDLSGRATLSLLLEQGLCPFHRVLDLGCGTLRLGYWLIRLLDRGRYYGLEPDTFRLEVGKKYIVGEELLAQKEPHFANNDDFDLTVFNQEFDFVVARSIWTHTSRQQIAANLTSLAECLAPNGAFFTSFWPAMEPKESYRGDEWTPKARYRIDWLRQTCKSHGFRADQVPPTSPLTSQLLMLSDQHWLKITRKPETVDGRRP
jgi:SAM-dependent methyltransferase